jgi:membrane protein YdbS with pleckstrin-like domain
VAATFEEKQDLIPEIPLKILVLSLIACVAFIIICSALGLTAWWQSAAFAAVSAAVIAVCLLVKVHITVDEANITVRRLRPYTVPLDHIIDVKKGEDRKSTR